MTGVAVDYHHVAAAARECDRGEQAGRTRADDDGTHMRSNLR
jgi:hypothetical protein